MALGHLTAALVSRRHPRVVLVHDGSSRVSSLRRVLAKVRPLWSLSDLGRGAAALVELRHWPPDVVVIDPPLGEPQGLDFLRAVAASFPTTVRMLYTEHTLAGHPALEHAHVALRRPASTEELVELLDRSVALSQALQRWDAGASALCH